MPTIYAPTRCLPSTTTSDTRDQHFHASLLLQYRRVGTATALAVHRLGEIWEKIFSQSPRNTPRDQPPLTP